MNRHVEFSFGPDARDRRQEAIDPSREGAVAALETFYYAFHRRDAQVMADVWSADPVAQLNNPVGGLLRGGDNIHGLYRRIFASTARVTVVFSDIVEYVDSGHALYAGRENGTYTVGDTAPESIAIRTSRYFIYTADVGRWQLVHHHGSIDDAATLRAYQAALNG